MTHATREREGEQSDENRGAVRASLTRHEAGPAVGALIARHDDADIASGGGAVAVARQPGDERNETHGTKFLGGEAGLVAANAQ